MSVFKKKKNMQMKLENVLRRNLSETRFYLIKQLITYELNKMIIEVKENEEELDRLYFGSYWNQYGNV